MEAQNARNMERRRRERQHIELPLELTAVDGIDTFLRAVTLNISSGGGVCFHAGVWLPLGAAVDYMVTLSAASTRPVRIACSGRVLRCNPVESGGNEIALTMSTYHFVSSPITPAPEYEPAHMAR